MKTIVTILVLASTIFFNSSLSAQEEEESYVIVEYMKVKPGMLSEYRDCEAAWKIIHQHRVKEGHITGWELEEVMFPSGANSEYDFLTITHYKNWDAIDVEDARNWGTYFDILSADKKDIARDADDYRTIVKREIWTAADKVFSPESTNSEYRVENFMKIPAGGIGDWVDMEINFAKPVIEKSIKNGNRAGWIMAFLVAPSGDALPYQASTVDFYKNWEQLGMRDGSSWEEVYGNLDENMVFSHINGTRTIVKSEIRRLIDSVE